LPFTRKTKRSRPTNVARGQAASKNFIQAALFPVLDTPIALKDKSPCPKAEAGFTYQI
jgi:hypothetical protein